MKTKMTTTLFSTVVLIPTILAAASALAETKELRLARQFGIGYLPYFVMQEKNLIEQNATKFGLDDVKVSWVQLGSGSTMNGALISGNIDFATAGIPGFLTLWDKSRGNIDVRAAAGFNNIPVFLNTNRKSVQTLKDFTDQDKIALPAVKVSLQALVLQMAAADVWGQENYDKLDDLTVSMKHPDGMIALLSGEGEITAHLTSPPYMFQELNQPDIHRVLSSSEVIGTHNFNVAYTTAAFRENNLRLYKTYLAALGEAMKIINSDKRAATEIYMKSSGMGDDKFDLMYDIVTDEQVEFTTEINGLMKFANFMNDVGTLESKPDSQKAFTFPKAEDNSDS